MVGFAASSGHDVKRGLNCRNLIISYDVSDTNYDLLSLELLIKVL